MSTLSMAEAVCLAEAHGHMPDFVLARFSQNYENGCIGVRKQLEPVFDVVLI